VFEVEHIQNKEYNELDNELELELELLQYTLKNFISSIHTQLSTNLKRNVYCASFLSINQTLKPKFYQTLATKSKLQKRQVARVLQYTRQGLCNGTTCVTAHL
jgi:hypothetical protein